MGGVQVRGAQLLLLLLVVTAAASAKGVGQQCAYVTDANSDSVSVINTRTNLVAATIPVGSSPAGVAVSPDGSFAYVADFGDDTVSVVNTATNSVAAAIPVGVSPIGVAISPNQNLAYVTNIDDDSITVINTVTLTPVLTTQTFAGAGPSGIAMTPNGSFAYIANRKSNTVSVLDVRTNILVKTIPVGNGPFAVAISPNGAVAYVANVDSGGVSVIRTIDNSVTRAIPVGSGPNSLRVSPNGARLFVVNGGSDDLWTIEAQTGSKLASIDFSAFLGFPTAVALSADGTFAYVVDNGADLVHVVDTRSNESNTDYALCVYDGTVDQHGNPGLLLEALAPAGSSWSPQGTGITYKSGDQLPNGITQICLRPGQHTKAKILINGSGSNLDLPPLQSIALALTVQLKAAGGLACWESSYGTVTTETQQSFSAHSP